ncbi:MAG: PH domain-containing protein [Gaiellaceae bacterium]
MLSAPEEEICLEARRHGIVLARPLLRALGLAAAGGLLVAAGWPLTVLGAPLVAAGAAVALRAVWRWERTRMVVTTEKVFVVHGTLRRRASAVRLRSIQSLDLEETLLGKLLGYGTVVAGPLELDHVPQARRVYRLVERLCA